MVGELLAARRGFIGILIRLWNDFNMNRAAAVGEAGSYTEYPLQT